MASEILTIKKSATKFNNSNEFEFVALLKSKDESSFRYLYDNYSPALYNIILQVVPDSETASDILQEVFVTIWRKINMYDTSKGRLFTWMLNVARNMAIDMLRTKDWKNNKNNIEITSAITFDSESIVISVNTDTIGVKKAVEKLKRKHRVLIDLAFFKGFTHEEISGMEKLPLGTVKSRMRKALMELRVSLN